MYITYRDELGYVTEEVDEYGISFCDGVAYVNDKKILVENVVEVGEVEK